MKRTLKHQKGLFLWMDIKDSSLLLKRIGFDKYAYILLKYYKISLKNINKYNLHYESHLGDGVGIFSELTKADTLVKYFFDTALRIEKELNLTIKAGMDLGDYQSISILIDDKIQRISFGAIINANRLETICKSINSKLTITQKVYENIHSKKLRNMFEIIPNQVKVKQNTYKNIFIVPFTKQN